jgi:predicted AlkP superfamily pyrophosphatase or phosphodiesterase
MKKLIICTDGLGYDLITKENTPFLYNFGKKNNLSVLKTWFAFTGIEYGFFTGETPEENRIWLEFSKEEKSVFNNFLLRFLSFSSQIRNFLGAIIQYLNHRTYISGLHNIPKETLKYFDSSAKDGLWKLPFFQNTTFSFYKWPFLITKDGKKEKTKIIFKYESDEERLERLTNEKNKEIYYTQLMSIDKTFHKFGKNSKEAKATLMKLDNIIEKYVNKFLNENKDAEIILWGDHGFADIHNYIDLEKILPKREDYLSFIGGTTISFWFKNEESKKAVMEAMSKVKEAKLLTEKDAKKYKIPLDKRYGDIVFYVKKGDYFFPNFYQKTGEEKFLAMHGYPDDSELDGFLISNAKKRINKSLKINNVKEIL